ncbi:hypothetical protein FRC11_008541, partial [Ceratobasidium sp. 423]
MTVTGINHIIFSARPANTEGEGVGISTEDQNDNLGRDAGEEIRPTEHESEPEAQVPPPRKRRRDAASTGHAPRKRQVRGKQGRLAGLMNMPIDIFTEVVNPHLAWIDEEYDELAAVPAGHERAPLPIAIIFKDVFEMWKNCKGENGWNASLMPVEEVPKLIRSFVHRATSIIPPGRKGRCDNQYVLSEDVPDLLTEYEVVKQLNDNDKTTMEAWIKARFDKLDQQEKQSKAFTRFLDALDDDREKELDDLKEERRSEIKRRVKELGWAEEDMPSNSTSEYHRTWNALVNQPKPLTDR